MAELAKEDRERTARTTGEWGRVRTREYGPGEAEDPGAPPAAQLTGYRPDIDGLRSIAIALVCLFHFDLVPSMRGGFVGVDVFFVISGYLISSLAWKRLDENRFSLRDFYVRRARRLAPALVCVQLLLLAFGAVFLLPGELVGIARESIATQLYVANVYFWKHVNYFGLHAEGTPLLHCWSLAVEEHFYLVYPLFLVLVHRYARRRLAPILTAVALGSFALNFALAARKPELTFYLLPTRAWELALGALLPFAQPWIARTRLTRTVLGLLGLGLVAAAAFAYHPGIPFPGTFALLPTLGAGALLLAGTGDGSLVSRALSARPLVYLGKISYSLYLVHWPLRVLAPIVFVEYGPGLRWWTCGAALLLSALLYVTVEDPIRRGAFLRGSRRFVIGYVVAVSGVLAILGASVAGKGWPGRFSPEALKLAAYADDQDTARRACDHRGDAADGACHLGSPTAPATMMVFGDSHAWALSEAFSQYLASRGEGGRLIFSHGCVPVLGMGDRQCQGFVRDSIRRISEDQTVRDVTIVSIWRQPMEGRMEDEHHRHLDTPAALAVFARQFRTTVAALRDAGKRVYVWEPLAPAKADVPGVLARDLTFGWHTPIETTLAEHELTFRWLTAALLESRDLIAGTISPTATMCRGGTCKSSDEAGPLFFDNNHPAFSRASFYARIVSDGLRGR